MQIEIGTLGKTKEACAYGGGYCLVSYHVDDNAIELMYCLRAKQISRPWFGQEKLLRRAGCPEPRRNVFDTWKCRYADGGTHRVS